MSIWDRPIVDDEEVVRWAPSLDNRDVVGPDVIEELGLTTTVYSVAFKVKTWENGAFTGKGKFKTTKDGKLYKHLGHAKGTLTQEVNYRYNNSVQPPEKLLLKGTITWEVITE